jgi:hypothetical protein
VRSLAAIVATLLASTACTADDLQDAGDSSAGTDADVEARDASSGSDDAQAADATLDAPTPEDTGKDAGTVDSATTAPDGSDDGTASDADASDTPDDGSSGADAGAPDAADDAPGSDAGAGDATDDADAGAPDAADDAPGSDAGAGDATDDADAGAPDASSGITCSGHYENVGALCGDVEPDGGSDKFETDIRVWEELIGPGPTQQLHLVLDSQILADLEHADPSASNGPYLYAVPPDATQFYWNSGSVLPPVATVIGGIATLTMNATGSYRSMSGCIVHVQCSGSAALSTPCGGAGQACCDHLSPGRFTSYGTCGGGGQPGVCGCTPDCTGKVCGASDGCGGICLNGMCPAGQVCNINFCM